MPPKSSILKPERAPGFKERLRALPDSPGVYIMRNRANVIIYVGKAKVLRNRVRTYFGSLKGQVPKVWRMVENVYDFEYIVTGSDLEALLLENELIKKHQPQYNIRLKDDKSYPFIKVTVQEEWPRVIGVRRRLEDGARYFGPYGGMGAVNETIDLLDRLFPFRTCDKEITGNDKRPCMQYFIHRCLGPCASLADKDAYDEAITTPTEVAMMRVSGELDELLASHIDPYEREFVPRIAASAMSVFALTIVSCSVVMVIAYLVMYGDNPSGFGEYTRTMWRVFSPTAITGFMVKSLAFGAVVAAIPIAAGLDATNDPKSAPVAVMGGMVRLFVALVLIELASLAVKYV